MSRIAVYSHGLHVMPTKSDENQIPFRERHALRTKDAALCYGVCVRSISKLIKQGKLSDVKLAGRRVVLVCELEALIGKAA